MPTFVVRLWLPDRPGALGAVAARIGAVRGDLVGIDILERGAGRAIDELVVELPQPDLVDLLVKELHEVDGVDVEEIRQVAEGERADPRLAALETAAELVAQSTPDGVLDNLLAGAHREFDTAWAAVVDLDRALVVRTRGAAPPEAWLVAFGAGATPSSATEDVAYVRLAAARMALLIARSGPPLRAIERRQLAALARIAEERWCDLVRRRTIGAHPSVV